MLSPITTSDQASLTNLEISCMTAAHSSFFNLGKFQAGIIVIQCKTNQHKIKAPCILISQACEMNNMETYNTNCSCRDVKANQSSVLNWL